MWLLGLGKFDACRSQDRFGRRRPNGPWCTRLMCARRSGSLPKRLGQ